MVESLRLLAYALRSRFKSRGRLEAEKQVLRQQLNVIIRELPKRVRLTNSDRLLLVWLYRLFPLILSAIRIIRPESDPVAPPFRPQPHLRGLNARPLLLDVP